MRLGRACFSNLGVPGAPWNGVLEAGIHRHRFGILGDTWLRVAFKRIYFIWPPAPPPFPRNAGSSVASERPLLPFAIKEFIEEGKTGN